MTTTPTFWSSEITIVPVVSFGILPKVTALADDTFIFGWEENPTANIHARHYNHFGSVIPGGDFLTTLSGSTVEPLSRPFFAQQADGALIVGYDSLPAVPGGLREVRWHKASVDSTGNGSSLNVIGPGADSIIYDVTSSSTGTAVARTQISGGDEFGGVTFLDSAGAAAGGGSITNGGVTGLAMAALSNGNVALAWTDLNPAQDVIDLQLFSSAGGGSQIQVSTTGVASGRADVAVTNGGTLDTAGDGEIVVVFDNANGIEFRRYTEAGAQIDTSPVTISGTAGATLAKITGTHDGGFIVAWQQSTDIILQRFDANGNVVGVKVPISNAGLQINPDLTTLDDGRVLLALQNETGVSTGAFTLDYIIFDPRDAAINGSNTGDTIVGRLDASTISGLGGDDTLFGNGADDTLVGGAGADGLDGGGGNDTASYANSAAGVNVRLSTGTGLGGDAAGDTLVRIENLIGSASADTFTGDAGANHLEGRDGDDTLVGAGGSDLLDGGAGRDHLVFDTALDGVANVDTVVGFTHRVDSIDLDNAVFAKLKHEGVLKGKFFHVGKKAADHNDFVLYNKKTGDLSYDADGSRHKIKPVEFANLDDHLKITHHDFLVI